MKSYSIIFALILCFVLIACKGEKTVFEDNLTHGSRYKDWPRPGKDSKPRGGKRELLTKDESNINSRWPRPGKGSERRGGKRELFTEDESNIRNLWHRLERDAQPRGG